MSNEQFQRDLEQAAKELEALDRRIGSNLSNIAKAGAIVLFEGAKEAAPVRTGKLRAGMGERAGKRTATSAEHKVFNSVFYARFVEYGTKKMGAQSYIRETVDQRHAEIVKAMEAAALAGDGI